MQGLLHKVARGCQAVEQVCLICLAVRITVSEEQVRVQPAFGDHVDRLLYRLWGQSPGQEDICLLESTGHQEQYMVLDRREWATAARKVISGTVVKVERR